MEHIFLTAALVHGGLGTYTSRYPSSARSTLLKKYQNTQNQCEVKGITDHLSRFHIGTNGSFCILVDVVFYKIHALKVIPLSYSKKPGITVAS